MLLRRRAIHHRCGGPESGKGPERSPVTVFDDDAIEESLVNTCTASLADTDRQVHAALERERERQTVEIELIASENIVSRAVREALGHEITNKTLEGYPSARNSGRPAVVLFADRAAVVGTESDRTGSPGVPWLELIGVEHFEANPSLHFSPIAESCD